MPIKDMESCGVLPDDQGAIRAGNLPRARRSRHSRCGTFDHRDSLFEGGSVFWSSRRLSRSSSIDWRPSWQSNPPVTFALTIGWPKVA